ncbi:MAG: hypothetical protein CM1200mP14_22040 [Gammaproteobacteria bacterium]|nr:MAG: hypothetical protein CM1200mP14_22040 [Gammaproteobacteria bacterium]
MGLPELLVLGTGKGGPPWFWVHDWVQVWFLEIEVSFRPACVFGEGLRPSEGLLETPFPGAGLRSKLGKGIGCGS